MSLSASQNGASTETLVTWPAMRTVRLTTASPFTALPDAAAFTGVLVRGWGGRRCVSVLRRGLRQAMAVEPARLQFAAGLEHLAFGAGTAEGDAVLGGARLARGPVAGLTRLAEIDDLAGHRRAPRVRASCGRRRG